MNLAHSAIAGAIIGVVSIYILQSGEGKINSKKDDDYEELDTKEENHSSQEGSRKAYHKKNDSSTAADSSATNKKTDEPMETSRSERSRDDIEYDRKTEEILRKTEKLRRRLGVSDDLVRESFREGRVYESSGQRLDEEMNIIKVLDKIIFIAAFIGLLYFANKSTGGDLMRAVVGIFPTEAKALGVKDYFERVGSTIAQGSSAE